MNEWREYLILLVVVLLFVVVPIYGLTTSFWVDITTVAGNVR